VTLLEDALRVAGGMNLWRQWQRYTLHLSIGGALFRHKSCAARLKELVVQGAVREQSLEIVGFLAADKRALYRPDWVALEGADGRRLEERHVSPEEFRSGLSSSVWDELQLAHYCGYVIWNYVSVPFIFSEQDLRVEELEPIVEHTETWRRLSVRYPTRVVTHAAEQFFYFDSLSYLRRLDYAAHFESGAPITQVFSGHQRFSGILMPTLSRMLSAVPAGASIAKAPWVDIEIFDAVFE
jgi:hypothetical protein